MRRLCLLFVYAFLIVGNAIGQDAIASSIIAIVNSARNTVGIPSLILSAELNVAAQRHSNDMANANLLSHTGSDNTQFWQRMTDAGYNLTTGAENLLLRSDANAQAVFNQWWNSLSHQANMMNPDYIEVGIGYAQSDDGTYYFTMVLGTRAGVVAPLLPTATAIPPSATQILPTITPFPPTNTHTPQPTATLTPTPLIPPTRTLSPLITPVAMSPIPSIPTVHPTATREIPPDIRLIYDGETLSLINISNRRLDLSSVSFQSDTGDMLSDVWDTEFLSEPLNNFSQNDCLQVWGFDIDEVKDKPDECEVRHGWIAVSMSRLFWQDTSMFWVLNDEELVGQCFVSQRICEVNLQSKLEIVTTPPLFPVATSRDIRLLFNRETFTLINIAETPIDLRGLIFQSSDGNLDIEAWETESLSASLGNFPTQDCLMVWTFGTSNQPAPTNCETRQGWIMVGDDGDFWREVTRFDVIRNNRILAGCVIANGFCDVSLAGNLGTNSPTVAPPQDSVDIVPTPVSSASDSNNSHSSDDDLTFVYHLDSFTLVNTSGHNLDISDLVFESDNGVFAANRWNTDFLTSPLPDFPALGCLQIWGVNEELQSSPGLCGTRHGWIAVIDSAQFWRGVSQFRVRNGANVIGTCSFSTGQCSVNLQGAFQ